jgi:hypothetical protein
MSEPIEIGKNITVTGKNLVEGLWPALTRIAKDPSLEIGVKTRLAAIYKNLGAQAQAFNADYDAKCEALKWETVGEKRKCLEQEALDKLNKEFEDKLFVVAGRKIKVKSLETAKISAYDLVALEPLLDGVFE